MDMDGFTSQDSFDAIRSAGSHFNDSFYPHSPASRTDEEIELLRNSEVGIPPQLTFDLGGSLLDFTPSTENDDRVRVGNLNGHLLTAQDGPLRLSESTKSWVYVDTISTVSSDFVNLTPRTRSPSLPLRSPPSEPHVPEEPRPVVGPRQTWQLPQKQKRGRKPLAPSEREASKKKQLRASGPKGVPRRTKPLTELSKQEIKEIKALGGACCACRYKKNKCIINPKSPQDGPCKRCTKLHPGLCYRYSVHDASLYREQARPYFRFSQRWRTMDLVDIQAWASNEVKFIEVSQTFVNAPYQLRVRQFIPQEGDNLEEEWFDGETMRSFKIPPYAIVNMEEAAQAIGTMIEKHVIAYLSDIVTMEHEGSEGDFIWETFRFAFQNIQNVQDDDAKLLIRQSFRMWQACRLTSYPEGIVGVETLGLRSEVTDPSSPWDRCFPIPPVMCAQLECILFTKFLRPWSLEVRSLLDKVIRKGSRTDWLSVYLALFVLLHSCGLLIQRDYKYARQINLETEYANPDAVKNHARGVITLLAHYHIVMQGALPFKCVAEQQTASTKTKLDFTAWEQDFVGKTYDRVRKLNLVEMRHTQDQKNPLYWLSQLYDTDWKPDKMD